VAALGHRAATDQTRVSQSEQTSVTQRLGALRLDSIRVKILVLAVLATLLPSVATAWISYLENKRSLTAKATEELWSVSAQTARELDLWAKERRYDLRVFASSYEVTENVGEITRAGATRSGGAYRRVTDYLKSVSERFQDYDELSIVGPSGQVVASNGDRTEVAALADDWKTRLRTDDFAAGTPYWDAESARPEMVIAVPIVVAGGDRVPGAMAAEVDLATLAATLARFAPGESGRVALLTPEGNLIVSSQGASADAMTQRYSPDTLRAQLASDGQPVEITDVTGERVLGSMRLVPGLDWAVVAAIPLTEVYGELARIRNVTLLVVAVTLIVAGGLGYTLGLVIVRPLDRLTRAAAKVAGGDLDVDLAVTKGGEVGYLTEVFATW
jgi:HAMP domain-containing protein